MRASTILDVHTWHKFESMVLKSSFQKRIVAYQYRILNTCDWSTLSDRCDSMISRMSAYSPHLLTLRLWGFSNPLLLWGFSTSLLLRGSLPLCFSTFFLVSTDQVITFPPHHLLLLRTFLRTQSQASRTKGSSGTTSELARRAAAVQDTYRLTRST